jgi:hypothetical protein
MAISGHVIELNVSLITRSVSRDSLSASIVLLSLALLSLIRNEAIKYSSLVQEL